jgi:predicted Zn-dependent protease
MKRHVNACRALLIAGPLALLSLQTGCSRVALTNRNQLDLIPASTMLSMSQQQYSDFLSANPLSTDQVHTEMVRRVGSRIEGAVQRYMASQKLSDQLNGYSWEFNLVENKEANAWCMPGGKVVVYTGILPITRTETGLAVVLGHEIAHAVAQHGSERMSQELLTQLGGMALSEALASKPQQTQQIWMTAFGLGTQYGALLPFSRVQENEADHLGLIFMAMAGYDPNEALALWTRMSQSNSGQAPPEFMSTHPSDATRIAKISGEMPEAMRYYKVAS